MDSQRVKVLHRSHSKAVVVGITYALELYFLPTFKTFLHKDLRCKGKCTFGQLLEGFLVGAYTTAQSA